MTQRDKVAVVRAMKDYESSGQTERAREMAEVAVDSGALDVDPATGAVVPAAVDPASVENTPAAAVANAEGIAAERRTRRAVADFAGTFFQEVLKRTPWGSAGLAVCGAAWALWRKRAVQQAATAAVGAINDFKHFTERVKDALGKDDSQTDWNAVLAEGAGLLDRLKCAGAEGAAAWKELSSIHAALKAKKAA
jgi:hypothetical protein